MHITQSPELKRLWRFEQASWPRKLRASKKQLGERCKEFPQGIFMLGDVCQVTVAPKIIPEGIETFEQMRDLPVDNSSNDLWVLNIATHPKMRGKGYASQLLTHVIKWARDEGYKTIQTAITCAGISKGVKPPIGMFSEKAEEVRLIPNYWEDDAESSGYGLLIKLTL